MNIELTELFPNTWIKVADGNVNIDSLTFDGKPIEFKHRGTVNFRTSPMEVYEVIGKLFCLDREFDFLANVTKIRLWYNYNES